MHEIITAPQVLDDETLLSEVEALEASQPEAQLVAKEHQRLGAKQNKASQAIQSPRTVPFFLLVSLLDGYSFPNVLVKGIVAFEH